MIELPPFFRRLNAQGRQRAIIAALLVSRLQEDPGAGDASPEDEWEDPSRIEPPEEFESDVEWDHWVGRYL